MHKLVLLRHGQSLWNKENRFTGWKDVGLSDQGIEEAKNAAKLLKEAGIKPDMAFTSVLKRAIRTLWICLEEMDLMWIPVKNTWRLNERHYGDLQGLNKSETKDKFGEEQVFIWRRSFSTPPPPLSSDDPRHAKNDPQYKDIDGEVPGSEALLHCQDRVLPYWEKEIAPELRKGKTILIAAHGNSLRALVKHLDQISEEDIANLNIPTGTPLVYELDEKLKPIKHYYLGDQEAIKEKEAQTAKV